MDGAWWVLPGAAAWIALLLLPWRPWGTRERLEPEREGGADLDDVVALIPARNEAQGLGATLRGLGRQGRGLKVVVVDDQSTDGTAGIAERVGPPGTVVVRGRPVPEGWSGKVWALEQGRSHLDRPLVLLLDADIELAPGVVGALRRRLRRSGAGLVSVMAELPMRSLWEKLLLPAFVYFFKLLYPFRLSHSEGSRVAAAAGGCVLCERRLLDAIGGFGALRDALIDDCRLAALAKARGARPWIGLSRSVRSTRARQGLADIWDMVARNAYTQLRYSPWLLALCTVAMTLAFVAPLVALALAPPPGMILGSVGLAAMMASYVPVLRFYELSPAWALGMPVVGALYLAMTWSSALRYWRGERSRWRGRVYAAGVGDACDLPEDQAA